MIGKVEDYLFFCRPFLLIPGVAIFILASNDKQFRVYEFVTVLLILILSYITNQIYDIDSDRFNNKNFFLPQEIITVNEAYRIGIFFSIVAGIFFLLSDEPLSIFLLWLFVNIFYNHPRFNWKSKPILSLLSAFFGGFFVAIIASDVLDYKAILYGILMLCGGLLTSFDDVDGDKYSDKITFVVRYGMGKSLILLRFLSFTGFAISSFNGEYILGILFALTFFYRILFHLSGYQISKYLILSITVLASFRYPIFIVTLILLFFYSRNYYQRKFGIKYP